MKNPYAPPKCLAAGSVKKPISDDQEFSLAERINRTRRARRRWGRICWAVGGAAILVGVWVFFVAHTQWADSRPRTEVVILDSAAAVAIFIGCGLISLGPISWFWFHRAR